MLGRLTTLDSMFDEFRRMSEQMDELFGQGTQAPAIRSVARGTYPPINMGVTPDGISLYLFAAGLDPKTIELNIQRNLLTVVGERKIARNDNATYYRRERFGGAFRRVIALPEDVDSERVEARYRDGILEITARRRESAKPRQITVQ